MEGKPSWFNVRQDVLNWQTVCLANNNMAEFKADLQKLYDSRMVWVTTAENIEGDGVTDATHKVIETQDMETQEIVRHQQELQVDTNARIYTQLGLTDGEILAMLA